jgi:hypothetical protein
VEAIRDHELARVTDVIQRAQRGGEDVSPGVALLAALEGIDFGHVAAIFRLPKGREGGGKEPPPAETGIQALALASIDTLVKNGQSVKTAIAMIAFVTYRLLRSRNVLARIMLR